jgi:hypothetical protein
LGIIGLAPFCFGLSVKAFSYKFQTLFDIFLNLKFLENGDFNVGFNLGIIANRLDAYINVGEIGITINFVAIAALSFLIEAYLRQRETGQFPIQGY